VDDEMIRDPECGIYFPQRSAVALDQRHQVLYFCSTECRDRYLARHSSEAPSKCSSGLYYNFPNRE
jgi:YHS domain-containing protein